MSASEQIALAIVGAATITYITIVVVFFARIRGTK